MLPLCFVGSQYAVIRKQGKVDGIGVPRKEENK
jgi:hypothetical protein